MDKVIATVTIRGTGSCYYARCNGKTASSTNSPKYAAQSAAMKAAGYRTDHRGHFDLGLTFETSGITLKEVTPLTFIAEWPAK